MSSRSSAARAMATCTSAIAAASEASGACAGVVVGLSGTDMRDGQSRPWPGGCPPVAWRMDALGRAWGRATLEPRRRGARVGEGRTRVELEVALEVALGGPGRGGDPGETPEEAVRGVLGRVNSRPMKAQET